MDVREGETDNWEQLTEKLSVADMGPQTILGHWEAGRTE